MRRLQKIIPFSLVKTGATAARSCIIFAMSDTDRTYATLALEKDVPLASFTTFKIGGPARYLVRAATVAQLKEGILLARREGLPFCVIGGGSNLLVSDAGFEGVVIRVQHKGIRVSGDLVEVQAGVELMALVRHAMQWGLSGLERLAGIPGLVGGAVRGNAGAYGSCIGDLVLSVTALDTDSLEETVFDPDGCAFDYRTSRFKSDPRMVVLSARLKLDKAPRAEIERRIEETVRKREAKKLQCDLSAGSFFMNPRVTDPELLRRFETEQGARVRDGRIPAGWLIDQAQLRCLRIGGAMVSARHANYLVNLGTATAAEMTALARLVKAQVRASLGVELTEEVSCLGFSCPPLPPS